MISRIAILLFFVIAILGVNALPAQQRIQLRNDGLRHEIQSVQGTQLFHIETVTPVRAEEVRLPRRAYRIPLDAGSGFTVTVQDALLSPPVDASPFYLVDFWLDADSVMRSRLLPYAGRIDDPAIGRGAIVLAQRLVYDRRRPMLEVELPLVVWNPETRQTQWIEEYTLALVPTDGLDARIAAEGKPPYGSLPFTTRSRNVDTSQAWIDFTSPMTKFFVRQDGLYRITADWLRDAGKDPAQVDPSTVQLYRKGVPVPMHGVGMEDGRFDDGDYFVFHGTRNYNELGYRRLPASVDDPYPEYLSIYSDSTAYWLNYSVPGALRAERRTPITPLPADTLGWTYERIHIEGDPWNQLLPHTTDLVRAQMSDWTSEDTWALGQFWFEPNDAAKAKSNAQKFVVTDPVSGIPARFWAKILSWYGDASMVPNHAHTLHLNGGAALDSLVFQYNEQALLYGTEISDSLKTGSDNIVSSLSWNINTSGSATRLDWFEVEYPRHLRLRGPSHIFRIDSSFASGSRSVRLQDVQTSDPMVLRIRGGDVALLPAALSQGSGPFTVFLADDIQPGDMLFVWNADSIPSPARGASEQLRRLDQEEAEHLIITARFLQPAVEEYAAFIEDSYNVSSRVVTIEDIYNVYSFGMFQPEAIKLLTFDAYYGWNTDSLKYLFLVGDANYNYRAWFTSNIVPSYGNPVSDTWFVAFDSLSVIPSLEVGRLPIREERWVRQYLDRHRAYRGQEQTLWNKSTLHFSGGNISGGEGELRQYKNANDNLINAIVARPTFSGRADHFYKTLEPQTDFGPFSLSDVRARIAEGGLFICYLGHSGTQTWDNSISRVDQLANDVGRATLITDFGCSTGKYAEPDYSAFSELFVSGDDSHAIAYIGNSAAGFVSTALAMPRFFYGPLVQERSPSIGDAHRRMRLQLGPWNTVNRISIQTNLLVGDPIVALDLPEKVNPLVRGTWIRPETEIVTDIMDSLGVTVVIGNYGLQTPDSLDILVESLKEGVVTGLYRVTRPMPALYDTLRLRFGLSGEAGSGQLRVAVDPDGKLDEIHENDNLAVYDYKVFSTFLKIANDRLGVVSGRGADFTILNPAFDPGDVSTVTVESDASPAFTSPSRVSVPYGRTASAGSAPSLFPTGEKRYWRAKLDVSGQDFVGPYLRRNGAAPTSFVQADSVEFLNASVDFVRYDSGYVFPPGRRVEILSSNFSLGSAVHIKLDGFNILPSSIVWGYGIVVVDSATLRVKRIGVFDNYNIPEHRDSIRRWAEEVTFGEYFLVTTGNEPRSGSNLFVDAIRDLGSKYIDTVRAKAWRPSWAFIGRRGAPVGTMPEVYFPEAARLPGVIDTSFYVAPDTGSVTSPLIGPAAAWDRAYLERSETTVSDIRLTVIGVRGDMREETLFDAGNVDQADLSAIDANTYPWVRLRANFYPQGVDPRETKLKAWSVAFTHPPELAVNYQSVSMPGDSLQQGEEARIEVGILNAGEGTASAFPVQLEVVGEDNIPRPAGQFTVAGLGSGQWFDTTAVISTDFLAGAYQVFVRVDRDDVVREQYEDNNVFVTQMYVKPDTSRPRLDVTFDGFPPLDDDYIRYNPEIVLTLYSENPAPVTSVDNFTVTLDGEEMDLDSIGYTFTPATKEQPATLRFQPTLSDGIYYFGFNAEDAKRTPVYDNIQDSEVRLRISTQSRLAELYNFPNPFSNGTAFTFLLTGIEPPQEMEIKVYTVAGRLIRVLTYPASSMRIGYNALKWDGRDEDGDELANGVYFYKVIARFADETNETIGRMAVLR